MGERLSLIKFGRRLLLPWQKGGGETMGDHIRPCLPGWLGLPTDFNKLFRLDVSLHFVRLILPAQFKKLAVCPIFPQFTHLGSDADSISSITCSLVFGQSGDFL